MCDFDRPCSTPYETCDLDNQKCILNPDTSNKNLISTFIQGKKFIGSTDIINNIVANLFANEYDVKCTYGQDKFNFDYQFSPDGDSSFRGQFLSTIEQIYQGMNEPLKLISFIDINTGEVLCEVRSHLLEEWKVSSEEKRYRGFMDVETASMTDLNRKKGYLINNPQYVKHFYALGSWRDKFITKNTVDMIKNSSHYIFVILPTQWRFFDMGQGVSVHHNWDIGGDVLYSVISVGLERKVEESDVKIEPELTEEEQLTLIREHRQRFLQRVQEQKEEAKRIVDEVRNTYDISDGSEDGAEWWFSLPSTDREIIIDQFLDNHVKPWLENKFSSLEEFTSMEYDAEQFFGLSREFERWVETNYFYASAKIRGAMHTLQFNPYLTAILSIWNEGNEEGVDPIDERILQRVLNTGTDDWWNRLHTDLKRIYTQDFISESIKSNTTFNVQIDIANISLLEQSMNLLKTYIRIHTPIANWRIEEFDSKNNENSYIIPLMLKQIGQTSNLILYNYLKQYIRQIPSNKQGWINSIKEYMIRLEQALGIIQEPERRRRCLIS